VLLAVVIVAVAANASAVRRLRVVALTAAPAATPEPIPGTESQRRLSTSR